MGILLLVAHLLLLGWLAQRPLSVPWVAPANLRPFATIRADLAREADLAHALAGLGGELLLLAPLGVLLPLAAGRLHRSLPGTCARTVFLGALISSGKVLLQSGVPGHVVNVDSVLLNTTGVALACLLVFPPLRARLRRNAAPPSPYGAREQDALPRREETGQGPTPRAARVGMAP